MFELWYLGRYVTASVPTLKVVRSNVPTYVHTLGNEEKILW